MMFPSGLLWLMETMDMSDLDSCLQTSLITTPHTSLSQNPDEDDDDEIYYDEVWQKTKQKKQKQIIYL